MTNFCNRVEFAKVDKAKRLVYGVVYAPNQVDLQGDFASAETIEKACHDFMLNSQTVKVQHSVDGEGTKIVQCYIAPLAFELGNAVVSKGSWVLVTKIFDDVLWGRIEKGELTGYSMAGAGERVA